MTGSRDPSDSPPFLPPDLASDLPMSAADLAAAMVDTAHVAVLVLDLEARVLYMNPFLEELLAVRLGEVRGLDWLETFVLEEDLAKVRRVFREAIGPGQTDGYVNAVRAQDGRRPIVEWYDRKLRGPDGEVRGLLSVGHDVTRRVRATQALLHENEALAAQASARSAALAAATEAVRQSESRLQEVIEGISDGVVYFDPELRFRYVSPAAARFAGVRRGEELLGRRLHEAFPTARDDAFGASVEAALTTGETRSWEILASRPGRWLAGTVSPAAGGVVVVFRDVTEAREARERLERSEAGLVRAQRIARLGSWEWDIETGTILWSEEIYRIFGLTPGAFRPTYEAFLARVHPDDRPTVRRRVDEALAGREPYGVVHRIVRPDGQERVVEERGDVDRGPDGAALRMRGTVQDVTERHAIEAALRRSEARLARAQRTARLGNWEWMPAADRIDWSDEVYRLLGHEPGQIEPTVDRFLRFVVPADRPTVVAALEEARAGAVASEHTFRVVGADGEERILRCIAEGVEEDGGARLHGTVQDVTDLKLVEAELLRSLAEKEVLLREIHHRVKNNLQVISSLLYLQSRTTADGPARALFADSRARIRAMAMVHQALYRSEGLSRVPFDEYVRDLVSAIHTAHRADDHAVEVEIAVTAPALSLEDAVPCGLITSELLTNAFKYAFPDDGSGTIRVSLHPVGDALELIVEDDGVGFPVDTEPREARSLGLRLVDALASQLGGELEVQSGASGSRFRVCFAPTPVEDPGDSGGVAGR